MNNRISNATKTPQNAVCPLCGLPIKDGEEWVRLPSGLLAHAACHFPTEDLTSK